MSAHEALRVPYAFQGVCELCQGDIDKRATNVCQFTSGWVRNRDGGGGHGLSGATRYERWAHFECVQKEQRGLLEQGLLF